ncbi:ABC transporter ATP-binding protein [Desulforamulus ruminis]|uniref:ABC transporter related protein n=1 Tax=Desulforamulus ruminis (strain ATCC 23193 / DSM 2154 / NCIMB 8452 / DL) TaxID=696281 RepID=F6DSQ3_DESRL|nr:ABC transporter ATP-binding protein [Desulforamulus ruminis]AEG58872.1 ABC transporter related protein [Desulforamulus ruminis DSM 2154]
MENRSEQVNIKISCTGISKSFQEKDKRTDVLEKMDLLVKENEFVVILGPGQSGKSTLFRIIAGMETPTTGTVTIDGREVTGPEPEIGFVFQRYTLFPWKTVLGNVEMGPKIRGVPKKERREIARHYINLVGLKGFENHYPHQLSGGMKQRVSIARAYANNPQIMLLDEPFGQLDAQTRILMEQETIRIWEAEKRTVCFVTNNIEEAIFLGDRIVTLDGKLPGRLSHVYHVDLPRPRDFTDIEFLKLRQKITDETQLVL